MFLSSPPASLGKTLTIAKRVSPRAGPAAAAAAGHAPEAGARDPLSQPRPAQPARPEPGRGRPGPGHDAPPLAWRLLPAPLAAPGRLSVCPPAPSGTGRQARAVRGDPRSRLPRDKPPASAPPATRDGSYRARKRRPPRHPARQPPAFTPDLQRAARLTQPSHSGAPAPLPARLRRHFLPAADHLPRPRPARCGPRPRVSARAGSRARGVCEGRGALSRGEGVWRRRGERANRRPAGLGAPLGCGERRPWVRGALWQRRARRPRGRPSGAPKELERLRHRPPAPRLVKSRPRQPRSTASVARWAPFVAARPRQWGWLGAGSSGCYPLRARVAQFSAWFPSGKSLVVARCGSAVRGSSRGCVASESLWPSFFPIALEGVESPCSCWASLEAWTHKQVHVCELKITDVK